MINFSKNIIQVEALLKQALELLNTLASKDSLTLFVINQHQQLVGTLTDGDIRRALLNGINLNDSISLAMNKNFKFLKLNDFDLATIDEYRKLELDLIPFLDENGKIIKIIDLYKKQSVLPIDVVIMAGGEGQRLRPLTLETPKPMLIVGNKPIIEHNIDRLENFGIHHFTITVKYLADKIINYFKTGNEKGVEIKYYTETIPLGTVGAVSAIETFYSDTILLMNSDLLTNIDYEEFYRSFKNSNCDMMVATIPYHVNVPYAVMETEGEIVKSFKEKPTYTYYSNAGIYLFKRSVVNLIPKNSFYNATDLMENIINKNMRLGYFPIHGYWLDIGQHADFTKAQEDIKHLKL